MLQRNQKERGMSFTDICTDCLEKIFLFLEISDLASVGNVCKTFNAVASDIFFRKFGNGHYSLAETSHRGAKKVKLEKIENLLKSFGERLRSLEISSIDGWQSEKPNDKPVLEMVTKYFCKNENDLKELKLSEFHFDASMVENVNILFGRLSKLTLIKCKLLDGTEELFGNCANLTKLKLDFVHTNPAVQYEYVGSRNRKFNKIKTDDEMDPCFNNTFPKMISLSLRSIGTATGIDLNNFLSKNLQLKKLKIVECRGFDGLIESVVEHLPNIETLSIPAKYIQNNKDMLPLKQLTKLQLNFDNKLYKKGLKALVAIARSDILLESLKLVDFHFAADELINTLSEFETLKQLVLVGNFSEENQQTLSENLENTQVTYLSK